jgi:hypothetical protein
MSFLGGFFKPVEQFAGWISGGNEATKAARAISEAGTTQADAITKAAQMQAANVNKQLDLQKAQLSQQIDASNQALKANVDQRGLAIKMEQLLSKGAQQGPPSAKVDLSLADPGKDPHVKYGIHKFVAGSALPKPVAGKVVVGKDAGAMPAQTASGQPVPGSVPGPNAGKGADGGRKPTPLPRSRPAPVPAHGAKIPGQGSALAAAAAAAAKKNSSGPGSPLAMAAAAAAAVRNNPPAAAALNPNTPNKTGLPGVLGKAVVPRRKSYMPTQER